MIDMNIYKKLLPYSLSQDPVLVAMFEALVIQLKEAYDEADLLYDLVNIDKLPEPLLDVIAYEKHVDFYDNQLTIDQKRELIKSSISWHRKKGTRWAVERVVSIVYPNANVYEWFEYDGHKYRFKIEVDEPFIASKDMKRLRELVEATKNKRSWLEYIAIKMPQTQYIELDSDQYHYPIYLPICGEIHCEGVPGAATDEALEIKSENYTYPVYLPICGEFHTNEVIDLW
ncbi:Bacteriophage P2-related tail formation protein [Lysinibacillus capsici]|uniref:Bacteriophage P2-related tail formation protein n=1 Tax=Lysinibacillus capsici TaxID=2115968 RepID=A0A2X0XP83_9BACI|nr:phage tail protein I [Lysinibacillus capsici]SPT95548.1 Bacteriophage P2-related tail formation protein [Lysinibacillus capsici]